ncbi:MAG: metal-dependent hydrolase [Pseudomonadota bacterium]
MNIIWLGHGSFRIEIAGQILLVDPWLDGNSMLDVGHYEAATAGATHILITHGHFDHTNDVVAVSQQTGAPVSGMLELAGLLHDSGAEAGHAFNLGGTIHIGDVSATLVPASHSSSMKVDGRDTYTGTPAGFILRGEGKVIYLSGDTDIMSDMDWIADYYKPTIGILSAGGYYTMDMAGAGYAAKRYFNFDTVIPCHYRTFPALEQSAEVLKAGLPGVDVIEANVMTPISL